MVCSEDESQGIQLGTKDSIGEEGIKDGNEVVRIKKQSDMMMALGFIAAMMLISLMYLIQTTSAQSVGNGMGSSVEVHVTHYDSSYTPTVTTEISLGNSIEADKLYGNANGMMQSVSLESGVLVHVDLRNMTNTTPIPYVSPIVSATQTTTTTTETAAEPSGAIDITIPIVILVAVAVGGAVSWTYRKWKKKSEESPELSNTMPYKE